MWNCWIIQSWKSPPHIMKALNTPNSRRKVVYRTINRFKETGKTSDRLILKIFCSQMKKISTIEQARNLQNDRIIPPSIRTISDKSSYIPRVQKALSIMVWAGISAIGGIPLVFVPEGVKINSKTYQELILDPVGKDLSHTVFSGKHFLFQQDGAPAHTSNSTQSWL